MLKKLAKCIREYKLATILTLIFIVCEVVIEIFIPFMTAKLITNISCRLAPGSADGRRYAKFEIGESSTC